MSALTSAVIRKMERLPPEKQAQVLDFVQKLEAEQPKQGPVKSFLGLCAHLPGRFDPEDLEAQRAEWRETFPRELP